MAALVDVVALYLQLTLSLLQSLNLSFSFGPKRRQVCSDGHQPYLAACCTSVGEWCLSIAKSQSFWKTWY